MKLVAPSLLSADFCNLGREIEMLNNSSADYFHVDVMDGVFVPNISMGFPVLKDVAKVAKKPLDVHLMITKPEKFVKEVKNINAEYMNFHYEACLHIDRLISDIHENGMKAGITLNPATPVCVLKNIIKKIDLVLIMGVNPGFAGQKFIDYTFDKLVELRELVDKSGSNAIIEVDGGVNDQNASELYRKGADMLVAGSFVFNSKDYEKSIQLLKK